MHTSQVPRSPANADRVITLNCGLGRDSITMLLLLLEGALEVEGLGQLSMRDIDAVVFSDTGAEWPHTYALIPVVRKIVEDAGGRFVVLAKGDEQRGMSDRANTWAEIERRAAAGAYHWRPAIMDDFQSRSTVVSIGKGDCTSHQKILPIRRLIEDIAHTRFGHSNRAWGNKVREPERVAARIEALSELLWVRLAGLDPRDGLRVTKRDLRKKTAAVRSELADLLERERRGGWTQPHLTLIGFAADEASRIKSDSPHNPDHTTEAFPLVTMGITKADESSVLERHGLGHVRKSGCYMCPYQTNGWWWALSVLYPELFARVEAYEAASIAKNPRINISGRTRGKRGAKTAVTIAEVVRVWREKNPGATVEAVLAKEYSRARGPKRKSTRSGQVKLPLVA